MIVFLACALAFVVALGGAAGAIGDLLAEREDRRERLRDARNRLAARTPPPDDAA